MKFIDEVSIEVLSGTGGRGCLSFRREKYIPFGGPDGGNGGRGGSVFLVANKSYNSLIELRLKKQYTAGNGSHGSSRLKHGKYGEDLFIKVPCGTKVYDANTDELIADITTDGQQQCVAVGADGGYGNAHFKSSTNRAPRKITTGFEGECRQLRLELNVLADVGLLGLPNAGKSTFLSAVSNASPKIADYPFTTTKPHLGVIKTIYGSSFVIADIPGLIEGAASGAGLGLRFLKHLSRCRLLLHIVDICEEDISASIAVIRNEVANYSSNLASNPTWLIFNKVDAIGDEAADEIISDIKKQINIDCQVYKISAVTGSGCDELLADVGEWVSGQGALTD